MRLTKLIGSVAFGAALVAVSATAGAQQRGARANALPLNYIDRGLTLPAGVLEPQIDFNTVHTPSPNPEGSFYSYNLNVGAAIGLSRNFEIQSTFLPMQLGPNQQYGDPNIQATLRIAKNRGAEIGARMNVTLHTIPLVTLTKVGGQYVKQSGIKVDSTTVSPGFPVLLRFNHKVRVDTGLFADITLGKEVTTTGTTGTVGSTATTGNTGGAKTDGAIWGLRLPVDLSFALSKRAYVGVGTGFQIDDLNQSSSSFSMPLKLQANYSIGNRKHPFLDINPYVTWDHLLTPGQQAPATTTTTTPTDTTAGTAVQPTTATLQGPQSAFHWDAWQMGVNLKGYFHFM